MLIKRTRKNSAFSLLETLVALLLMSIISIALYGSLYAGFKGRSRAKAALSPVRAATLAAEPIRNDLEAALPPTGILAGAFIGQDQADDNTGADADSLIFFADLNNLGGAGICKVELAVVTDDDTDELVLVRNITQNLLAPETPDPAQDVLCRKVVAFNLRYYDGTDWQDSWDSTTLGDILPPAVEVTLQIDATEKNADTSENYTLTRIINLPSGRLPDDAQATAMGAR